VSFQANAVVAVVAFISNAAIILHALPSIVSLLNFMICSMTNAFTALAQYPV
jgi:hypothetical protein